MINGRKSGESGEKRDKFKSHGFYQTYSLMRVDEIAKKYCKQEHRKEKPSSAMGSASGVGIGGKYTSS